MNKSLEKLQLLIDKSSTGNQIWLHNKLKDLKKTIIEETILISNKRHV